MLIYLFGKRDRERKEKIKNMCLLQSCTLCVKVMQICKYQYRIIGRSVCQGNFIKLNVVPCVRGRK